MYHGKVRAMFDDRGKPVKEAGPSMPIEVLGINGVPTAGDGFAVVDSDRKARQIAENRQEQQQKNEFLKTGKITLEELHHHIKDGSIQELRIVIKADVHGSVEALSDALARLSTEQVRLQVIHGGVGAINETDVMLAAAESNAIVLGFNVRPVAKARELAEKEQIDMRLYTVIYQAIEDIKKAMEGLLEPTYKEVLQGQANVQATFSVPKIGVVAGCRVVQGKITRNSLAKLYRDHKEIYKGTVASLRRVKDDVREVTNGYECGIKLENYNDIKEGDIIESYALEKVILTLETAAQQR
jgi:translation initiation factor IF-2